MEAREKATTPAPATTKSGGSAFITRELNGATFLTLEHLAHMALVVVVTALLAVGIMNVIALWTGDSGALATSVFGTWVGVGGGAAKYTQASMSLGIVAALIVLVPLLVVLDRRTRAEWHKRAGYAGRLAYKLPVYTALGVLAAAKTVAFISMLAVVLSSLALIGVNGSGVGDMYLYEFLPALVAVFLFGASGWYVFRLAKGVDRGARIAWRSPALARYSWLHCLLPLRSHSTASPMPVRCQPLLAQAIATTIKSCSIDITNSPSGDSLVYS
jgi:hypothetical protein